MLKVCEKPSLSPTGRLVTGRLVTGRLVTGRHTPVKFGDILNMELNCPEAQWVKEKDIDCILWNFIPHLSNTSRQESERRRKLKDALGVRYPDTIMLDSRTCATGREYCDALVYSENHNIWIQLFREHYECTLSCELETSNLEGGNKQYNWSKSGTSLLSVSVYASKAKFMVQPGDQLVSNLCDWISQFGCLIPRYIACTATNNDIQSQNIQNGSPDSRHIILPAT